MSKSRMSSARPRRGWMVGVVAVGISAALAVTGLASAATKSVTGATAKSASQTVNATIKVTSTFDGANKVFNGGGALGDGGQSEKQQALFDLAAGATIANVVIGANGADGIHCAGSCTLRNIVWQDVGEDAATFRGANATVLVDGGSAASATDKVFQDNRGAGGSVTIRNFKVSNFGKLYRSCGNCKVQAARTVIISNVTATAPGKTLVGANSNLGDRVTVSNVTISGAGAAKVHICDLFNGNNTGKEPTKIATAPDGVACKASGVKTT